MSRWILKAANSLVSLAVSCVLCIAGAYAAYALWDNQQVYAAAENVQADMIKLKPDTQNIEEGASFEELRAINPDVCAWVTLDNTGVDYPVLQGETNLTYINQDVYGDFALAGSIFLDSRCDNSFSDAYSLLYGHHMENGKMFGDLDLYKEEAFFEENTAGMLILPDRTYQLEILACLIVPASEDAVFEPGQWRTDIDGMISHAEKNALHLHEDMLEKLKAQEGGQRQLLALSTCSSEFTDARTVILAVMKPYQGAD